MIDLTELLRAYEDNEEHASNGRVLLSYLHDVMQPFKWTTSAIEVSHNLDFQTYRVDVWLENLPYFHFRHEMSRDALLTLFDPNVLFIEVGLALQNYWKSIPRVEPEDHIILGES